MRAPAVGPGGAAAGPGRARSPHQDQTLLLQQLGRQRVHLLLPPGHHLGQHAEVRTEARPSQLGFRTLSLNLLLPSAVRSFPLVSEVRCPAAAAAAQPSAADAGTRRTPPALASAATGELPVTLWRGWGRSGKGPASPEKRPWRPISGLLEMLLLREGLWFCAFSVECLFGL